MTDRSRWGRSWLSDEEGGSAAELSCISRNTLTATAAARALSRLSGDVKSDASGSVRLGPRNLPTTQTPAYKTISNAKAVLTPMAVRPNPSRSVAGSTPNVKVFSLLARNNGFDCTTNIHAGHRHPAYRYSFHARVAWGDCYMSTHSDILRREAASEGEFSMRVVLGLDHVSPFGRVLALVKCGCGG